jgi:hypothetical protein
VASDHLGRMKSWTASAEREPGLMPQVQVNLQERWERVFWCERFGTTADQLQAAVRAVGPAGDAVATYLTARQSF